MRLTLLLHDSTGMVSAQGSFRLLNLCAFTVWVGSQSNSGQPILSVASVGLDPGTSTIISAPPGWAGRFWGRTGCLFDSPSGQGTCSTGDCGGAMRCTGIGGNPPATLVEFTLNGDDGKDYYDVSLVDGYNLPVNVAPTSSSSSSSRVTSSLSDISSSLVSCGIAGCTGDLNESCPPELRVLGDGGQAMACKSACDAFGGDEYCCTGGFGSPTTCLPTSFSQAFKAACPNAYSYAYDDASSIFTCTGGSYSITFCPQGPLAETQGSSSSNSSTDCCPSWLPSAANPRSQQQSSYSRTLDSSACCSTYSKLITIVVMSTLAIATNLI
ncbi:hypothetical protein O6H91_15G087400 [Diphasiastrum complanatum]|uniref:Uncharacterized protein n=1 Tax=Diphasiastrum complanatum TaxID=34168 RepID=A0ACC2BKR5_DIPCM|nr:hypothetical protein O6H91_Y203700 [Diphasiastrum complanatum]KAJ7530273.1 hypothetical protein O6H91_15G087400 [Diphasiastrum complanatum]